MRKPWILVALAVTVATPALASDMRFCDMSGEIESAVYRTNRKVLFSRGKPTYDLTVAVSESAVAQGDRDMGSYTDCSEFIGVSVDIRLDIPKRLGEPQVGDRIEFYYSQIDTVGVDGYGTSVCAELHQLAPIKDDQSP